MSNVEEPADQKLRDHMLEAMVDASLSGHELTVWEIMDLPRTYTAACIRCGQRIRIDPSRIASELDATCRARDMPDRLLSQLRAAAHLGDEIRFEKIYFSLLAHFSSSTLTQLQANREAEEAAWSELPAAFQRSLKVLRRLLEQKRDKDD